MTPGNFNWFLHAMLFYHTRFVLERQKHKKQGTDNNDNSEDDQPEQEVEEENDL